MDLLTSQPCSSSRLPSLNATLNSPAERPVLSSAQAPTIEDLNQLSDKLTEVQLSSAEASEDDSFNLTNFKSIKNTSSDEAKDISLSTTDEMSTADKVLPQLPRDGATSILVDLCDAVFQAFEGHSI